MRDAIASKMDIWLRQLCADAMGRSVGTAANREASELFIRLATEAKARMSREEFGCLDYDPGQVFLSCGNQSFEACASPFSKGCQTIAVLEAASSLEELQKLDLKGKILLLHSAIAASQIMPKNFVFYNPDEHRTLVRLLESSGVSAVISASPRQPELNGALYPTPMFEDGDLSFASAYMSV